MSAATHHDITACGRLYVVVCMSLQLLSLTCMLQALLRQVQTLCNISQRLSGNRKAVCKQPVPTQQKGCLQAASA